MTFITDWYIVEQELFDYFEWELSLEFDPHVEHITNFSFSLSDIHFSAFATMDQVLFFSWLKTIGTCCSKSTFVVSLEVRLWKPKCQKLVSEVRTENWDLVNPDGLFLWTWRDSQKFKFYRGKRRRATTSRGKQSLSINCSNAPLWISKKLTIFFFDLCSFKLFCR